MEDFHIVFFVNFGWAKLLEFGKVTIEFPKEITVPVSSIPEQVQILFVDVGKNS